MSESVTVEFKFEIGDIITHKAMTDRMVPVGYTVASTYPKGPDGKPDLKVAAATSHLTSWSAKPTKLLVLEQLVRKCIGGVQVFYIVRPVMDARAQGVMDGYWAVDKPVEYAEVELVPYPSEVNEVEKGDNIGSKTFPTEG